MNIVIGAVIVSLLGMAAFYIYKARKNGQACIGCPHSRQCNRKKCGCSDS